MIGCLNGIWWSKEIGKKRKLQIYEAMVKSSLLYGSEIWRVTENLKKKLEATEMDAMKRAAIVIR